jgi:hypothetical protein
VVAEWLKAGLPLISAARSLPHLPYSLTLKHCFSMQRFFATALFATMNISTS